MKEKKRTIHFGKIDYLGCGRRANSVDITLKLTQKERDGQLFWEFSAHAGVWNNQYTGWIAGGQILDELVPFYGHNPLFQFIYEMWEKYHLNGMNPGTKEQMAAVKTGRDSGELKSYGYEEICEYLKQKGLYEVDYHGNPYRYGQGHIVEEISEKDLERISNLIDYGILLKPEGEQAYQEPEIER